MFSVGDIACCESLGEQVANERERQQDREHTVPFHLVTPRFPEESNKPVYRKEADKLA